MNGPRRGVTTVPVGPFNERSQNGPRTVRQLVEQAGIVAGHASYLGSHERSLDDRQPAAARTNGLGGLPPIGGDAGDPSQPREVSKTFFAGNVFGRQCKVVPMNTTLTKEPRTYSQAAKLAEDVTSEEIAHLINHDDNPVVWRKKGGPRRIAMNASFSRIGDYVFYSYCNPNGFTDKETVWPSRFDDCCPIFHFRKTGRTVRWVKS